MTCLDCEIHTDGINIAHSTLDMTALYEALSPIWKYHTNISVSIGLSAELYRIWSLWGGKTGLALGHI